jgi:hypothetical protein
MLFSGSDRMGKQAKSVARAIRGLKPLQTSEWPILERFCMIAQCNDG